MSQMPSPYMEYILERIVLEWVFLAIKLEHYAMNHFFVKTIAVPVKSMKWYSRIKNAQQRQTTWVSYWIENS